MDSTSSINREKKLANHASSQAKPAPPQKHRITKPEVTNKTEEKSAAMEESASESVTPLSLWQRCKLYQALFTCWFVSTMVHLILFLVLAMMLVSVHKQVNPLTVIVASLSADEEELVPEIPIQESSANEAPVIVTEMQSSQPVEVPVMEDFLASATVVTESSVLEDIGVSSLANQEFSVLTKSLSLEAGDGTSGKGIGGDGMGKMSTSVFGVKTTGKRFVYVVDNSNSMKNGKIEGAIQEILKSVEELSPKQEFYVIFYSDTAYPMMYPNTERTYLPATKSNIYRLRDWLATVQRCLHTNGEKAMEMAFQLNPDVIYLIGDGAFSDDTVKTTLAQTKSKVTIHAFGFDLKNERDKEGMETIAKRFNGKFYDVKVTPEMVALENKNNRPRNKSQNGVWGLKLPVK